jgi:predicted peptidase
MKTFIQYLIFSCFFCPSILGQHAYSQKSEEMKAPSEEQLLRLSYQSPVTKAERDYFVYLPRGYESDKSKEWPVMLFLHGGGERGNGKEHLKRLLANGPIYEAWILKRDLPFIIISPQMPLFGRADSTMTPLDSIAERMKEGAPKRNKEWKMTKPMVGVPAIDQLPFGKEGLPDGWGVIKEEVMAMVDSTLANYRTDKSRVYLTGLSYGGFGTWIIASSYPDRFAAIAPIVGWGHPDLMQPIVDRQLPVWCISGGRDFVVENKYFFAGINKLQELGHQNFRFTVHEDMGHDVWTRVYGGEDIYNWLLEYQLKE